MKRVLLTMVLVAMSGCAAEIGQEGDQEGSPEEVGKLQEGLTADGNALLNRSAGDTTPIDMHYGSGPGDNGHGHYYIVWGIVPNNLCLANLVDSGSRGRDIQSDFSG